MIVKQAKVQFITLNIENNKTTVKKKNIGGLISIV